MPYYILCNLMSSGIAGLIFLALCLCLYGCWEVSEQVKTPLMCFGSLYIWAPNVSIGSMLSLSCPTCHPSGPLKVDLLLEVGLQGESQLATRWLRYVLSDLFLTPRQRLWDAVISLLISILANSWRKCCQILCKMCGKGFHVCEKILVFSAFSVLLTDVKLANSGKSKTLWFCLVAF